MLCKGWIARFSVKVFNSDRGSGILWRLQINPGSPDFRHKVTRGALWLDAWSTPQWAKLVIQGESQHPAGHHTQGPQDVVRLNRYMCFFNPNFMNDEQKLWTLFL